MRRKFYLLLLLLIGLPNQVSASRDICGAPPPDQFREENNESIKGDLTGKANFLSGFVGKAELGGKIEATRKDIFAKYPDANTAYMDRYLAYMFCYILFDPNNKQSPEQKIKAIQEFRFRQQSSQPSDADVYSGSWTWVYQGNWGQTTSQVRIKWDPKSQQVSGTASDSCGDSVLEGVIHPEKQSIRITKAYTRGGCSDMKFVYAGTITPDGNVSGGWSGNYRPPNHSGSFSGQKN